MRTHSRRSQHIVKAASLVLAVGGAALPAAADDKQWAAFSGLWSIDSNWSPAGEPTVGDDVSVTSSDAFDRTVAYGTQNVLIPRLNSLAVDSTGAGRITLSLASSKMLSVTTEAIGVNGWGSMTQSNGTNRAGTSTSSTGLFLAFGAGSRGTYSLSGGLLDPYRIYLGNAANAQGVFIQTGGTATLDGILRLGASTSTSYGGYDLEAGTLSVATGESVGYAGTGTFLQNGGVHTVATSILIGANSTAHGTLDVRGGTLDIGNSLSIGPSGTGSFKMSGSADVRMDVLSIGANGSFSFPDTAPNASITLNQANGFSQLVIGGSLHLGKSGGLGAGTMALSSAMQLSVGQTFEISNSAPAAVSITGGTHYVVKALNIGVNTGTSGTLDISAGTLEASGATIQVASNGTAQFNIGGSAVVTANSIAVCSGGTLYDPIDPGNTSTLCVNSITGPSTMTIGGTLLLGQPAGRGSGIMDLTNNIILNAARDVEFGHSAPALVRMSGGLHSVGGSLRIAPESGGAGTFQITGGHMSVGGSLALGWYETVSTLTLETGTLAVAGDFRLYGNNTTPNSVEQRSGTLNVQGTEELGYVEAATFTQSGGQHTAATIWIGRGMEGDCTYNLDGGTLTVSGWEYVGRGDPRGRIIQDGGYNNPANLDLADRGTYVLNSGTLTVPGTETIGSNYQGIFQQSGGAHTAGDLSVGVKTAYSSSAGTYTLSGTGTLTVTGSERIGSYYGSTFTQNGGLHTSPGCGGLYLGFQAMNPSAYILTSGTLSMPLAPEYIGCEGTKPTHTFSHSGGANTAAQLYVGYQGLGRYDLSGTGSLTISGPEYIGYTTGGSGTFNQTAGDHRVGGTLTIASDTGSTGLLNLSGGALAVGALRKGAGTGTFNWTGGTLRAGTIDSSMNNGNRFEQSYAACTLAVDDRNTVIGGNYEIYEGTCTIAAGRTLTAWDLRMGTTGGNPTLNLSGSLSSASLHMSGGTTNANADVGLWVQYNMQRGRFNANVTQNWVNPILTTGGVHNVVNAPGVSINVYDSIVTGTKLSTWRISQVWAQVCTGYNGGSWDGDGFNCTTIAHPALNGLGLKLMTGVNNAQYLSVREMILGDVNGDDKVTIGDVMVALNSANYQQNGTWLNGDVNYDGKVTVGDVMLMLNSTHYQQVYDPANAPAQFAALEAAGLGDLADRAVPEPATLALLAIGALGFLARRRRG